MTDIDHNNRAAHKDASQNVEDVRLTLATLRRQYFDILRNISTDKLSCDKWQEMLADFTDNTLAKVEKR